MKFTDAQIAAAMAECDGSRGAASRLIGMDRRALARRWKRIEKKQAAERGELGFSPVLPGFRLSQSTDVLDAAGDVVRQFVQQKPEHGEAFAVPDGHLVKGISALIDADGREIVKWVKTREDAAAQETLMRAVVEAFKEQIPRAKPVPIPRRGNVDLLNQYTVTDLHFGMLSWREETGADYDLKIAEKLLLDWFTAAVRMSPDAQTAVLAQLGDLLHYDSYKSVTPEHGHILDSDSRFQKMIRIVLRVLRQVVRMLLEKHEHVEIIMADANHDPASGAWLREMFAAFYEDEPRIHVNDSASTFYVYEHGETSLFYHHGHKRGIKDVDGVFAGRFRAAYGRTRHSYAHIGHKHSDELISTNLMKVERHETLAPQDAFAANGGFSGGRSAKVITYHKQFGEVGRITLTPEMVTPSDLELKAA